MTSIRGGRLHFLVATLASGLMPALKLRSTRFRDGQKTELESAIAVV
ncbi:MAG: hypothetical protein V7K64_29620 [Nostoc sp.]